MPKTKHKKRRVDQRANIWLPLQIRYDLKIALEKRAALDKLTGRVSPTSLSAFVREKAIETIAAFR